MTKPVCVLTTAFFLLCSAHARAETTTCNSVAACVFASNKGSGYAIEGSSKSGNGVVGTTTKAATSPSTGQAGVSGYDKSTNNTYYNSGVYGTSPNGYGVQGKSASGIGVAGFSSSGTGVSGTTSEGAATTGFSVDRTTNAVGVSGIAQFGTGVVGSVDYNYGVYGESADGVGLGALAYHPGAIAVQAVSLSGDLFQGYQLVAWNSDKTTMKAEISSDGDMTLAGTLTTSGTPNFRTNDTTGASVVTYGARATTATLEDTGEASLVHGEASIRLDPRFARTINQREKYLVFLTPEGDSHGLYTSNANSQGFTVHENDGGRSSVAFAYRIVARPFDDARGLRLPSAGVLRHQLAAPVRVPKAPDVLRFDK